MASPVGFIERSQDLSELKKLQELVSEHQVEYLVVGNPISLDGQERQQARSVRRFCKELRLALSLPVVTWDERYSSVEAERLLRQQSRRSVRERGDVDSAAAALILQTYLDSRRRVVPGME